jgi:hypothetical protein
MSSAEATARAARAREAAALELHCAIGLAWGLVDTGNHDEAFDLCRGCLLLWPESAELLLLLRLAAIEAEDAHAPPESPLLLQRTPWGALLRVLRRRLLRA